jgi:hypothetical protein
MQPGAGSGTSLLRRFRHHDVNSSIMNDAPIEIRNPDVVACAPAKSLNAPLLFKGDDFRCTDVTAAQEHSHL